MSQPVSTSRLKLTQHAGAHHSALLEGFEEPIHFGVHGGCG